ncbi:hypothetical protein ILUMI_22258 [Ignelater luminosus]|uniref:Eukaryotic translation initiation factor 4 gamma 2 n=1 Tax=Ignelater luminosus TaxID=2038154 RepID=A0A8K0G330_IGNLU|nr:hypothetical protein ILUMI_22258 [Ignelater luminosus]
MYAQLCKRLSEEAPNFEPASSPCTFRLLLLNKCKAEFESRSELLDKHACDPSLDEEERRQLAKRKMLGNIKFIGELGKLEILSEGILHRCIQELLASRRGDDPSEDLECLSQIMRTCGRILDSDKGKKLMDQYFERMAILAENTDLPPRIRFMLKDVIELRRDNWVPRKVAIVEGPMPIHQIQPTDDDRPGYRRDRNQDRDQDRSNTSELFRHRMKMRTGIEDMLIGLNLSSTTTNLIPTHSFSPNGFGNQRDGGFRTHNNQRSGFSYNNQRGQYKHNQTNSNNQFNSQSNKDLAPRFKKNFIVPHEQDLGEVQLRPSANSMLFNKTSMKTNSNIMNNKPADPQLPPPSTLKQSPAPLLKEPLPIKPASSEKPKQGKKDKGPNKEEVLKKFASLLEEFFKGDVDIAQAIDSYKEHKIPDKFSKDVVVSALTLTVDKTDQEIEKVIKFLTCMKKENLVNTSIIQDSFKALCNSLEERENEITKVTSAAASILAVAATESLMLLADVATLTDNGAYYPLFLLVLQQLHKVQGKNELTELFNNSKINLLSQLPENDKTKMRLAEILEERDLTFLYPPLRIQAELTKQLQADPNPQQFYKWIKENLDASNYIDPGFINALMTVLLKYITQEAATTVGDDKAIGEKEHSMLERYRPILRAFLHEQPSLQLIAVYSLQVHFYELGFPRGQLLRWFMALYDLEIVEEEAFLTWKEDVTDAYPGKGQALFQVNQWLTWLQEAESEEEEGDE